MMALQKHLGHRKKRKQGEERREEKPAVAISQVRAPLLPPVCSKASLSTDLHRSSPDSCLPSSHLQRSTGHLPVPPPKPQRAGERCICEMLRGQRSSPSHRKGNSRKEIRPKPRQVVPSSRAALETKALLIHLPQALFKDFSC